MPDRTWSVPDLTDLGADDGECGWVPGLPEPFRDPDDVERCGKPATHSVVSTVNARTFLACDEHLAWARQVHPGWVGDVTPLEVPDE